MHSFVKREDLVSEMTVVRNEFERGENSPQGILMQRIHAAAYEWHNYGKSTIGNRSDIERVPIENLQAFYRKYYQPDNVVLIVAGKFEEKKALGLVQEYLGTTAETALERSDDTYTEEPAQDGERTVVLRRVGGVGAVGGGLSHARCAPPGLGPVELARRHHFPAAQRPALQGPRRIRRKPPAPNASAGNNHDPVCSPRPRKPNRLNSTRFAESLLKTIEELAADRSRRRKSTRPRSAAAAPRRRGNPNSVSHVASLSSASALGDWRLLFMQRDRLHAVTADDVNRVAKTYFQKHNRTVGVYIPEDAAAASGHPASAAARYARQGLQGRHGGRGRRSLRSDAGEPRRADQVRRPRRHQGWAFEQEKPRRNRVAAADSALRQRRIAEGTNDRGGHVARTDDGRHQEARPASAARRTRQTRHPHLSRLGGFGGRRPAWRRGRRGGVLGQLTFSIEAKRSTLPAAIKLLGEILREPAFPAAEFDAMKRRGSRGGSGMQTEPATLASNRLARAAVAVSAQPTFAMCRHRKKTPTPGRGHSRPGDRDLREASRRHRRRTRHRRRLRSEIGPDSGAEILKDWKSDVPVKRIERTAPKDLPAVKKNILTPDKANAVFVAGLAFPLKEMTPTTPPCASATSCSAAARCPLAWATASARRKDCPTA